AAVASIVRSVFSQPDHASAMGQLHDVARMLESKFPQAAELLEDASEDVLAHLHFPLEHRRRLHSTNPLERLHKEIKRRTRVVGIFPTRDSLMRMVGTLLAEQDDEWPEGGLSTGVPGSKTLFRGVGYPELQLVPKPNTKRAIQPKLMLARAESPSDLARLQAFGECILALRAPIQVSFQATAPGSVE